ncbi:uncharacterized protein LOC21396450 isoform X2 [Morus notabilis]|nr:uncharacterized protein LOC21396450 isoform X2 [Morus notabilis]
MATPTFLSPNLPTHTSLSLPISPNRNFKITSCVSINQPQTQLDAVSNLRVAFACGGTGGHIYPAVAIADELKLTYSNTQILFLGTPDSMESAAIATAGYDFEPITAVRLARPVLLSPQNLLLPYRLIKSTLHSYSKLKDFDPHLVIGTGGYVSLPPCLASVFLGEKTKLVIQEQNSVPGVANWVISHFSDAVFVAFNSTVDCFPRAKKCVVSGNPVRLSLKKDDVLKAAARAKLFPRSGNVLREDAKVVLVLGGSLGANAVNIAMLNVYSQMLMENERLFIIWQTGVEAFDEMESLVKNHPNLHLTPFMHSIDLAYLAGDLVISRAGAMTCSEILAHGKPSILI